MAQLQAIISSILRDVLAAQHEANLYSLYLSESYRKEGQTEAFPLPSIAVGEMELDIYYGIKDVGTQAEQYEINYPLLRKTLKNISFQLAKVILDKVIISVLSSPLGKDKVSIISKIKEQPELNRNFTSFLERKLLAQIMSQFTELLKKKGGVNEEMLGSCTVDIGVNELLYHPELFSLFTSPEGEEVRQKAYEEMKKSIFDYIPKLVKDLDFRRKRIVPSVDVIVAADELSKLPEECIHKFKFKVSPRSLSLNLTDDDEENQL